MLVFFSSDGASSHILGNKGFAAFILQDEPTGFPAAYLIKGDMDRLAMAFCRIIRIPTYDMRIDAERFYQALIYSVASLSGRIEVRAEEHKALGRSDLVFIANGRVVIVEMKMDRSVDEALLQIESRRYMDKYLGKGCEIVLLGVNILTSDLSLEWKEKRFS